jgi:hypothetical protein
MEIPVYTLRLINRPEPAVHSGRGTAAGAGWPVVQCGRGTAAGAGGVSRVWHFAELNQRKECAIIQARLATIEVELKPPAGEVEGPGADAELLALTRRGHPIRAAPAKSLTSSWFVLYCSPP